ncbi:MAG: hypothetical protein ACLTXH_15160 [Enterobacter hormaechei]
MNHGTGSDYVYLHPERGGDDGKTSVQSDAQVTVNQKRAARYLLTKT